MNLDKLKKKRKQNKSYSTYYPKLVAISLVVVIVIGTILLMLPMSVKSGSVSFTDALFTATSATCVTGLVVFDTFKKWTLFGQLVILAMVQIGGLGFITIVAVAARFFKKRATIKDKILFSESIGSIYKGDTRALGKRIVIGTILFEVLGAIILATQYIPMMNFKNGLYTAVFMSVSAFCNAGFDVMGRVQADSSLITVNSNPVILLTVAVLAIVGGIGFIVWDDLICCKFKPKKFSLHTKITISTTAILLALGTVIYFVFEYNGTFNDMSFGEKLLNSFFTSTTTRSAGFNSVPNENLSEPSRFVTYFLTLIGGSSASTASGIKTSTIAVLFVCIFATLTNSREVEMFGKRISNEVIKKAAAILCANLGLVIISTMVIALVQPQLSFHDVLFECISAVSTAGMSAGITSKLNTFSKIVIMLMMFTGRFNSITFIFINRFSQHTKTMIKPMGDTLVG